MTLRASTIARRRQLRLRSGWAARTMAYALLIVLSGWALLPPLVMAATAFKPRDEIFRFPPRLFPEAATVDNFITVLAHSNMPRALGNSMLAGLAVAALTLLLGGTTGFALARWRFQGAGGLAVALLLGQLLPATVLLAPIYRLVVGLGFADSIPGVVVSHLGIVLPLVVWMMASTFKGVPVELEEAAMIDGCTRLGAVLRVVVPVARPGIVAVGVFAFLQSWNEFLFASVITLSDASLTAPVALTFFAGESLTDWGATMAAATVLAVPVILGFLLIQKHFVRGMAAGAVKG